MAAKKMKKQKMQPDLAYIGEDGKLHDDGLHDEMLASEAGNEASRKAAYDAAIKRGLSEAEADRFYGRGTRQTAPVATVLKIKRSVESTDSENQHETKPKHQNERNDDMKKDKLKLQLRER